MRILIFRISALALALACLSAADANAAFLVVDPLNRGTDTNWSRRLAVQFDPGFDTLEFVYRSDFDTGGGFFDSPHVTDFLYGGAASGPASFSRSPRNDWAQVVSTTVFARAQGTMLTEEWLPLMLHYSGDGSLLTGFDIALFQGGTFLSAFEVQWGQMTSGPTVFNQIVETTYVAHRTAVIPEPGSLLITGLGLGVAAIGLKRRQSA